LTDGKDAYLHRRRAKLRLHRIASAPVDRDGASNIGSAAFINIHSRRLRIENDGGPRLAARCASRAVERATLLRKDSLNAGTSLMG
jgi:hypothetical protein